MEDFEGYDIKVLYEILYEGELQIQEIPKAKTFKFTFTKIPEFKQPEEPEKLEQLLTGKVASKKVQHQSFDPLDLVGAKELHELSHTEKTIKNYLSEKRKYQTSKIPNAKTEEKEIKSCSDLTCVSLHGANFVTGDKHGTIQFFSQSFKEIKRFGSKSFGEVTSIDVSVDGLFLLAGYSTGQVVLWNCRKGSLVKASGSLHNLEIVKVAFWNSFSFGLSCDIGGKIVMIEYSKSFLNMGVSAKDIAKGEYGQVYDLQVLKKEAEGSALDKYTVVAAVTNKGLLIFTIYPEVSFFFNSTRPQSCLENTTARLAWKLVNLNSEFYALTVAWGSYIVVYRVNSVSQDGVKVFTSFDSEKVVTVHWLSAETLFLSSERTDKIILPLENKIIYEATRSFDLVSRSFSHCDLIVKGTAADGRKVFLFGQSKFETITLLNWLECVDALSHKGEWLEVLCFGLDLYWNDYPRHFGSPETPEELRNILEQLITIYVKIGTIDWVHKISNTIEFCVEVDGLDILFNLLLDYFVDHGEQEGMECFINTLEPYILSGKIKKIPSVVIGKLIVFYIKKNNEGMIEKILLNVDPGSLDTEQVMPIIKEYKLFTIGIVIYCNDGDFISPINLMTAAMAEESEMNKTYLFYKVLWYLRLSFRGEIFLHGRIYEERYKITVEKTIEHLIKNDLFSVFIEKDAVSTLKAVFVVFELRLLANYKDLLRALFEPAKKGEKSLLNFSLFVLKVSENPEISIEHDIVFAAIKCLIVLADPIESYPISGNDITSYIHNLTYGAANHSTFIEISVKDLGKSVLRLLHSSNLLESEQKSLLSLKHIHDTKVKTYLLDIQGLFEESLVTLLSADDIEHRKSVFDWINRILKQGPHDKLKGKIVEKLTQLVEIDSDKTAHLVKDWFKNSHTFFIKKLDSAPNLQLKYLAELSKDQFDKDLLLIYVRLLSQYDQKTLVKFLKTFENDFLDETLKICRDNKATEAEALLNEKQGGFTEALDLWNGLIGERKSSLVRKVYRKEQIQQKEMLGLGRFIRRYSKVCIRNSKALDQSELEQFWLKILRDCLDAFLDFKDYLHLYPLLEPMLNNCLNLVLENMLEHVDLRSILDIVTFEYEDFQFKHLRNNIVKVLEKVSHQRVIKQSALSLFKFDLDYSVNRLFSSRLEGHSSDFFYCRSCGRKISQSSGSIFIFACGHVFHKRCQDLPKCLICNNE